MPQTHVSKEDLDALEAVMERRMDGPQGTAFIEVAPLPAPAWSESLQGRCNECGWHTVPLPIADEATVARWVALHRCNVERGPQ